MRIYYSAQGSFAHTLKTWIDEGYVNEGDRTYTPIEKIANKIARQTGLLVFAIKSDGKSGGYEFYELRLGKPVRKSHGGGWDEYGRVKISIEK